MSKVLVVYWSGSGNTKEMADNVVEGAKAAGAEVVLKDVSEASVEEVSNYDTVALGCPAMGDDNLEEGEMEPFVESLEGNVSGKKIGLFGSYDWGDGDWMANWKERMQGYGADVVGDVIANLEPDDEAKEKCQELGKTLAAN